MAENKDSKKTNFKKLIFISFVFLNITFLAIGTILTYLGTVGSNIEYASEEKLLEEFKNDSEYDVMEPLIYKMKPFTVNLFGLPKRVINLEINLQMIDEEGFEEVIDLGARTRDKIIRILNKKSFSDIESIQGKLFLKEQIIREINDFLVKGVVKDIYFSKFNVAVH